MCPQLLHLVAQHDSGARSLERLYETTFRKPLESQSTLANARDSLSDIPAELDPRNKESTSMGKATDSGKTAIHKARPPIARNVG